MILSLSLSLFLLYFCIYVFRLFHEKEDYNFVYVQNHDTNQSAEKFKFSNIKLKQDINLIKIVNKAGKKPVEKISKIKKGRISIRV
ncbi:MAG: hypothetical protein EBU90_23620 [Proteobacteria bacterium]|nr:hypothetical protein [Pseudomonadota bacterium]NBP16090.1 hypothetical protein [bacterium]